MNELFDENGMLKTYFDSIHFVMPTGKNVRGADIVKKFISNLDVGYTISQIDLVSRLQHMCKPGDVRNTIQYLAKKKIVTVDKSGEKKFVMITVIRKIEVD